MPVQTRADAGRPEWGAWRTSIPPSAKWIAASTTSPVPVGSAVKLSSIVKNFRDRWWSWTAWGGAVQIKFGKNGTVSVTAQTDGFPVQLGPNDPVYIPSGEMDDYAVSVYGASGSYLVIWPSSP